MWGILDQIWIHFVSHDRGKLDATLDLELSKEIGFLCDMNRTKCISR